MSDTFDFDEEQYKAFKKRLEQDSIKILVEMDGGYSGARTSVVQVEALHSDTARIEKGKYILKVCLSKEAGQEIEKHKEARESPILGAYVPELVEPLRYDDIDISLTGILYQIAGESLLTRTTLREKLKQRHFQPIQQVEKIASVVLRWNLEAVRLNGTSDLLETILQGIGEQHLTELEESLQGIGEHLNHSRIYLTPFNVPMYNPIYFLRNRERYAQTRLRQMAYLIPRGTLHRDLHPGNVIISKKDQSQASFYLIDFASSRPGNAFFDLAYLELSTLLNSRRGFGRMHDVEDWWDLEQHLISEFLTSERKFQGANREELRRVLPIRQVLDACIKQEGESFKDDYWIAFLAASVEAGLDLARKIHHDHALQRVAFLIAVSRFDHLVKSLEAINTQFRDSMGIIYWPEEESSSLKEIDEKGGIAPASSIPRVQERKAKIELVWPAEITRYEALYDPWRIVDGIWSDLTGTNDQGVLLLGERRIGKSSFFNCIIGLFPKEKEDIRALRLDTLGIPHSAQTFATEVLRKICQSVGLQNSPNLYAGTSRDFEIDSFLLACQSAANEKKEMRFVLCIDEIDSTLATASAEDDARLILQLLFRLLTDLSLPVRLLLTTTSKEALRHYRSGTGFVDNLRSLPIPLCSKDEMRELLERFEVPLTFDNEALERIFHYSGGQIYFIKLAVKLALSTSVPQTHGKRLINGQMMDELMYEVIEPTEKTAFTIRSMNGDVFPTMKNIYSASFSEEEREFMQFLTRARGIWRVSNPEESTRKLMNAANLLYERGYVSKKVIRRGEEYSWRIGIWQLFLANYYQLKYRRNRGKQ